MKITQLKELLSEGVSHNHNIGKKVMLRRGELGPVMNFSQATFPAGEVATKHCHDDMGELFFVQSGYGEIVVNGSCYTLEAGSCVVVQPGEYHELKNSSDEPLHVLCFGVQVNP